MCQTTHHHTVVADDELDEFRGLPSVRALTTALDAQGFNVEQSALDKAIGSMGCEDVATVTVWPWTRYSDSFGVEVTLHWADHHCVRLGYTLRRAP